MRGTALRYVVVPLNHGIPVAKAEVLERAVRRAHLYADEHDVKVVVFDTYGNLKRVYLAIPGNGRVGKGDDG